jgi:hypothetical protein
MILDFLMHLRREIKDHLDHDQDSHQEQATIEECYNEEIFSKIVILSS